MSDYLAHRPDGSVEAHRSRVPEIATAGAIMALSVAFWGGVAQGSLGGGTTEPRADTVAVVYLPPNAPTVSSVKQGDSAMALTSSDFIGDMDDFQDSAIWQIVASSDTTTVVWADTTATDLLSIADAGALIPLDSGGTYQARAAHHGELSGKWSDFSVLSDATFLFLLPPPTPGECSWCTPGAEPLGWNTVTDNPMSSFDVPGWGTPYATTGGTSVWCGNDYTLCTEIIVDPTSLRGGDNKVLRNMIPEGLEGGGETLVWHIDTFAPTDSVFVAFYMKWSSNFVMHPSQQKLAFVTEANLPGFPAILSAGFSGGLQQSGGWDQGLPPFFYRLYLQGSLQEVGGLQPNVGDSGTAVDQWKLVEWLLVQNSADGLADGEWHMWVDGGKKAERYDIHYGDVDQKFSDVYINFNWGGRFNIVPADQYIYVDSWYVSIPG